jgi:hypothetical protein
MIINTKYNINLFKKYIYISINCRLTHRGRTSLSNKDLIIYNLSSFSLYYIWLIMHHFKIDNDSLIYFFKKIDILNFVDA